MSLSPGQWYKQIPKGLRENLEWRRRLLEECDDSSVVREAVKKICAEDILFYLNAFAFTYDPRKPIKAIPFITWPIQDAAILGGMVGGDRINGILEAIEDGKDLCIQKSRDMGASWMSIVTMEWLWHFHPYQTFLMVSRKESSVDQQGDPDSLFWKIDFIHSNLPKWMLPNIERRRLHFGQLDNGSTIDGESTTAAAGVGGRRTAVFIDEFSRIEDGRALFAGTADTSNCRIFNFTPYGTGNAAYELSQRKDVRHLRLHWSKHPEKAAGLYQYDQIKRRVVFFDEKYVYPPDAKFIQDGKLRSPWYDAECERRANERDVAQMLDIDYLGSQFNFFEASLIDTLKVNYGSVPLWEGDILFDPDTGRPVDLTRSPGGPLKLWIMPDLNNQMPDDLYTIGGDISAGMGSSNSCLSIGSAKLGKKVAEFTTPFMQAEQFAFRAIALGHLFNNEGEPALLAWENAGPGVLFGKRLMELSYGNVFYREVNDIIGGKRSRNPGWSPTAEAKRILFEEYRSALSMRFFINPSIEALDECLFFVHHASGSIEHVGMPKDDPSGAKANHGDRVIADALCWKLMKHLGCGRPKAEKKETGTRIGTLAWRRELHDNALRVAAEY